MLPLALLAVTTIFSAQTPAEGPPRAFPIEVREFAGPDVVLHPIGLSVDDRGRVYAAETRRYTVGVQQSRGDTELEDLELQARTVAEYEDVLRAQVAAGKYRRDDDKANDDPAFCFHEGLSDEVARYEDTDGDGRADARVVFADGFDRWYSGPAADVLVDGDRVWLANVPDLWRLVDADGDGRATGDEKEVVRTGFGVVFSFLGHDMHGLVRGPDGRLYWSVGDRSFHVETDDGRTLEGKTGAVFRMNPDGSNLELFAIGLRNPQDLAFTTLGDLWTGDNNCDKGDRARIVHVVEGSDQGWRLSVQRAASGGPWLREKTWWSTARVMEKVGLASETAVHQSAVRPAWALPPLHHPTGQGPSGAFAYPGVGLPARYDDHQFLTHCAGGGGFIQAFAFEPDGAALRVNDFHVFVESNVVVGPSDAEFGPDGRIYSTNWGSGWDPNDDASLVTIAHAESLEDPRVADVRRRLAAGFEARTLPELAADLGHVDVRVRTRAQFTLAARGDEGLTMLLDAAEDGGREELARMHGVWGAAQSLRERRLAASPVVEARLVARLGDASARVRERAAEAAGDLRLDSAIGALIDALEDDDARVRFHAALALGKLGAAAAREPLVDLLKMNADRDPVLRHGAVFGLAGAADDAFLAGLRTHRARSVRLGALLGLRRRGSPEVAAFLGDDDLQVASEAARAIYDLRVLDRFDLLAAELDHDPPRFPFDADTGEGMLRRAIAAAARLGGADQVRRLLRFAAIPSIPAPFRLAALDAVAAIDAPPPKDAVWFDWWPVEARAPVGLETLWRTAQAEGLLSRIAAGGPALRARVYEVSSKLLPPRPTEELLGVVADEAENPNVRRDAFEQLVARDEAAVARAVDVALGTSSAALRIAALDRLVDVSPLDALTRVEAVLRDGTTAERQAAILSLPRLPTPKARYVRFDLPGDRRILSLAEVRVLSDGDNAARLGRATQSSTGWDGPPHLAIDESTHADHSVEPAVTHTENERDPWWELDLGREHEVEAIEVFNRTDGGHHRRLDGVVVSLLGADRAVRWSTTLDPAPEVETRIALGRGGLAGLWADRVLGDLARSLATGRLDPALAVEVVEAATARGTAPLLREVERWRTDVAGRDPLGVWSLALDGGDAARGEETFRYDAVAQCIRCHSDEATGGNVGPDLVGVGRRRDASHLVRALVTPQADLTPGFGAFSAMPGIAETHAPRDVRDLVAWLKTLTEGQPAPPPTTADAVSSSAPAPSAAPSTAAIVGVSIVVRGIALAVIGLLLLLFAALRGVRW